MVISRSFSSKVQKLLLRFKKIIIKKVEEILVEKILWRSKKFQIEKFEIEKKWKFTIEIINIFKIFDFSIFQKFWKC